MKKIKLGRREFELMPLTLELFKLLKNKSETLDENLGLDEERKSDVGDLVLFVLLACFSNEYNALQVGQMLLITEKEYITADQVLEALSIVREAIDEWK